MLKIAFTGDLRLEVDDCRRAASGRSLFEPAIVDGLRQYDYVVSNLEGPATVRPSRKPRGIALRNSLQAIPMLRAAGVNVLSLANNHVMDHGPEGLRDTLRVAEDNGCLVLGAGENPEKASEPLVLRRDAVSVGLVAVCHHHGPATSPASPGTYGERQRERICQQIDELRGRCQRVVLVQLLRRRNHRPIALAALRHAATRPFHIGRKPSPS